MAATVRQTITRALRKLRVVASGDEPTAAELADGLSVVQGMFDAWATGGMFGRLNTLLGDDGTVSFGTDEYLEVVVWEAPDGDATVELPVRVRDIYTNETRTPPDLAFAELVDETTGNRKTFIWDARQAKWVRLDNLTVDSVMPLAARSTEGMAAVVAMKLSEEFGAQLGPLVAREAGAFLQAMSTRYGEQRQTGTADFF